MPDYLVSSSDMLNQQMSEITVWILIASRITYILNFFFNKKKKRTKKNTCCLEQCANVNRSGGAATAYFKKDIWPSAFFQTDPHTAWRGNGSCMIHFHLLNILSRQSAFRYRMKCLKFITTWHALVYIDIRK